MSQSHLSTAKHVDIREQIKTQKQFWITIEKRQLHEL